ncbi:MAG: hypothetical protein OXH22_11550 [Chloroflexi bacterium]|nr:hypothetical protein [Chloroflexota bacterium]
MSDRTKELGKQAMDALKKAVLSAFVDANGGQQRIADVARAINIHEHNNWISHSVLRKLEDDGIVKQLGKGKPFILTDQGQRKCRQLFGDSSV